MRGEFHGKLRVQYIDGHNWRVLNRGAERFYFLIHNGPAIMPKHGYITDFASVPKIFRGILPATGDGAKADYGESVVIHDWLCDKAKNRKQRKYADRVFKAAMESRPVAMWRRVVMYCGVRIAGFFRPTKRRK